MYNIYIYLCTGCIETIWINHDGSRSERRVGGSIDNVDKSGFCFYKIEIVL